mmetsp:Transcript_13079/g.18363  ORF Transcript_13079/g.18363 Transcript_13079/m.18363 type:complete len:297 (+) Transcript_13079:23-913(+)
MFFTIKTSLIILQTSIHILIVSSMNPMIAVVTGANKGIGFEIARKIGSEPNWKCVLTARDEKRGNEALHSLLKEGKNVCFKQLDITDKESIEKFFTEMEKEYGKIDCLVNNAGFAFKAADPTPFKEQAEPTFKINFFGTVQVTEKLLPLIRSSECRRIVNVASMAGHLKIIPSNEIRNKLAHSGTTDGLSKSELLNVAESFVNDVKAGTHSEKGWPNTTYGMSKLCLIAYTKILAMEEPNLKLNCCCPGYCATDMTSMKGYKSAEAGAETPFQLAVGILGTTNSGKFYSSEQEIEW